LAYCLSSTDLREVKEEVTQTKEQKKRTKITQSKKSEVNLQKKDKVRYSFFEVL
jgi:hypothetical protein